MRKWNAAILAVAFLMPSSFAQTQEDVLQELKALKTRVSNLETENADLRGAVTDQNDQVLESQISALTDRLVAGTTVKSAANPVTLTGEFRFRNTWSLGDNAGDDEHDGSWNDALVRLGFQYDFTRDVTAFAELQSHWAFGDGASTSIGSQSVGSFDNGTDTSVDMHQAWLEVRNLFDRAELSTRTGRQEIVLGNQFQFGNADWYNGWAFDGTRWDWDSESFSLTAMILKLNSRDGDINQVSSFFTAHDDDELYSIYFTLKTIKNHELDLYWIYINGHAGDGGGNVASGSIFDPQAYALAGNADQTAYYHTIGGRIGGMFPDIAAGLDWNVEFAYQFGDLNTDGGAGANTETDIDAFALEAELGVTFNKESMFRAYLRFLWAEGPDDDELGYINLFTNRHSNSGFRARYGIADLVPMTNVVTLQGGFHFDPADAWTLGASVIWATADEDNTGAFGGAIDGDDDYGWELDIWAEYRYSEHLIFNMGLAFVFPEEDNTAALFGDDDMQFIGYLQARLLF